MTQELPTACSSLLTNGVLLLCCSSFSSANGVFCHSLLLCDNQWLLSYHTRRQASAKVNWAIYMKFKLQLFTVNYLVCYCCTCYDSTSNRIVLMQIDVFLIVLYVHINKLLPPLLCIILPFISFQQLPVSLLFSILLCVVCFFELLFLPTLHFLYSPSFIPVCFYKTLSYLSPDSSTQPPPSCTSSPLLIIQLLPLSSLLHRSASYYFLLFVLRPFSVSFPFFWPVLHCFLFLSLFRLCWPCCLLRAVLVIDTSADGSMSHHLHAGKRFSKNTAKGYLTTYACGSASVHKHTLSLYLSSAFFLYVFVSTEVYIPGMLACQIWSYPFSVISPRIATLIPFSLAGSWPPPNPTPPLWVCVSVCLCKCMCVCEYI